MIILSMVDGGLSFVAVVVWYTHTHRLLGFDVKHGKGLENGFSLNLFTK